MHLASALGRSECGCNWVKVHLARSSNQRSLLRMEAMCEKLDGVLVELMECLDKLEMLRKRFSEAVSEVS